MNTQSPQKYVENNFTKMQMRINGRFIDINVTDIFVAPDIKVLSHTLNRFDKSELRFDQYFAPNEFFKTILIGEPGCGKTLLLKYMCAIAKSNYCCFPVYLHLASYGGQNLSLLEYLKGIWQKDESDIRNEFHSDFEKGKILFLLDGLDYLPDEKQRKLFSDLNEETFKKNKVLITSRFQPTFSYAGYKLGCIKDFDEIKIKEFARKIFYIINPDKCSDLASKFSEAITKNTELYSLAKTPLFLSILIDLYSRREELPHKRIEIYNNYLKDLISSNEKLTSELSDEVLLRVLSFVAYNMTKNASNNTPISSSVLNSYFRAFFGKKSDLLYGKEIEWKQTFERLKSIGVFSCERDIYDSDVEKYSFSQDLVREYLAALYICYDMEDFIESGHKGRNRYKEIIDIFLPKERWHNILQLVIEYITSINSISYDLKKVLDYILDKKIVYSEHLDAKRALLAGECLTNAPLNLLRDYYKDTILSCRTQMINILNTRSMDISSCIRAARVLAQIGDPRFTDFMPKLINIPIGEFEKGTASIEIDALVKESSSVKLSEDEAWIRTYWEKILYSEAAGNKVVKITKNYRISKYPITNMQYSEFLAENPDHPVPLRNTDEIDDKGAIYSWKESTRSFSEIYSNNPVVFVSWHDACDYCTWLSKKTGRKFRLPTEEEWEFAARGSKGSKSRRYPWKGDWRVDCANTIEANINEIVPVGCFVDGKSAFGLYDCAGQIWEWTATEDTELWESAWPDDMRTNDRHAYIVKGGAWDDISVFARSASRGPNAASFKAHYIGFRIVEEL